MIWPAGHTLQNGKYQILDMLGQGGFGVTYRARHVQLRSIAVVKTPNEHLRHDPDYGQYIARFVKEGRHFRRPSIYPVPWLQLCVLFCMYGMYGGFVVGFEVWAGAGAGLVAGAVAVAVACAWAIVGARLVAGAGALVMAVAWVGSLVSAGNIAWVMAGTGAGALVLARAKLENRFQPRLLFLSLGGTATAGWLTGTLLGWLLAQGLIWG